MKVEVWYAVDEDGGQYLFTSKPKRYVEGDSNYWINLNCPMRMSLQEILIIRRYLKKIEYN